MTFYSEPKGEIMPCLYTTKGYGLFGLSKTLNVPADTFVFVQTFTE